MSRTPNTPAEGSGRRGPGALRRIAASRDAKMTLVLALVVVAPWSWSPALDSRAPSRSSRWTWRPHSSWPCR